jgi:hypothetical protein
LRGEEEDVDNRVASSSKSDAVLVKLLTMKGIRTGSVSVSGSAPLKVLFMKKDSVDLNLVCLAQSEDRIGMATPNISPDVKYSQVLSIPRS